MVIIFEKKTLEIVYTITINCEHTIVNIYGVYFSKNKQQQQQKIKQTRPI